MNNRRAPLACSTLLPVAVIAMAGVMVEDCEGHGLTFTIGRGNELRAQTELNKAIAELQRATGNALEQNRVEIRLR